MWRRAGVAPALSGASPSGVRSSSWSVGAVGTRASASGLPSTCARGWGAGRRERYRGRSCRSGRKARIQSSGRSGRSESRGGEVKCVLQIQGQAQSRGGMQSGRAFFALSAVAMACAEEGRAGRTGRHQRMARLRDVWRQRADQQQRGRRRSAPAELSLAMTLGAGGHLFCAPAKPCTAPSFQKPRRRRSHPGRRPITRRVARRSDAETWVAPACAVSLDRHRAAAGLAAPASARQQSVRVLLF